MKYITDIPGKYTDYCTHPEDKVTADDTEKPALLESLLFPGRKTTYFCNQCHCYVYPVDENEPTEAMPF